MGQPLPCLSPSHANHAQASDLSWVPFLRSNFPLPPALKIPFLWTITCLCCSSCMFQALVLRCHVCLRCVCLFSELMSCKPSCTFLCVLITLLCRRHSRCGFNSQVRKILRRRKGQPISIFSPGEFHGQRSLLGYSP